MLARKARSSSSRPRSLRHVAILYYAIYDDPTSLLWCAGLLAVGVVLYLAEQLLDRNSRPRPGSVSRTPKGDL